jgi:CHASE1-domain containing sensor protein
MEGIIYRFGNDLDLDQVIELYQASSLGERRPIDDRGIMADMIRHGNMTVTAWEGDQLVGISRSMLVLLSAPQAVEYYPKIGFTQHNSAWILKASDPFPAART